MSITPEEKKRERFSLLIFKASKGEKSRRGKCHHNAMIESDSRVNPGGKGEGGLSKGEGSARVHRCGCSSRKSRKKRGETASPFIPHPERGDKTRDF